MKKRLNNLTAAVLAVIAALLLFAGAALLAAQGKRAEASTILSEIPPGLEDLFTDYTRTSLSDEYASEEALEKLRSEYGGSGACEQVLDRAGKALRGEVRFDGNREFSTVDGAANPIEQYGDLEYYSNYVLKWGYPASDLQITGIYGVYGDEFTVYVEADDAAYLPRIVFTNHHAPYSNYRVALQLFRGANTFSYVSFGSGSAGAVYILNPYTEEEQKGDVSIYIEGGDFYPVFEKDGDADAFLGQLDEYENKRKSDGKIPDLAELVTDFAFITTTSSSLYNTYIKYDSIDPQLNLELWGDFFTKLYEFNGIPTSADSPYGDRYDPKNRAVRINFRYMKEYPDSGAYAYRYHIGFYNEHYWFANFYNNSKPVGGIYTTGDYSLYAMGHEVGHMLDTDGRRLAETTNNMTATFAYLKVMGKTANATYQPYERSLLRLESDDKIDHLAYDDGKILYTNNNYDHNYMIWWYLESCFPGYWGKLNYLYRYADREQPGDVNERMVYLSSLVTGTDLGAYFERWGLYLNGKYNRFTVAGASQRYSELMKEAEKNGEISKKFDRFYYADDAEYGYILAHPVRTEYTGDIPKISVRTSGGKRVVSVSGKQDPAFLGYEVRVSADGENYITAGFTRSAQFTDERDLGDAEPFYKVVAVNRYFNISEESEAAQSGPLQPSRGVCKANDKYYNTLAEGIDNVGSGGTVYIYEDCAAGEKGIYKNITLEPGEGVANTIRITVTGGTYMFMLSGGNLTFKGRPDARFLIDGASVPRTYPPVYAGSGTFTAEYVDFVNHSSGMGGGAFIGIYSDIVLRHCSFLNCTGKEAAVLSASSHTATVEDCAFVCDGTDLALKGSAKLVFENNISALTLETDGEASVYAVGFIPDADDLAGIVKTDGCAAFYEKDGGIITFRADFKKLVFDIGGTEYSFDVTGDFVFGQENLDLGEKYISEYRDAASGKIYHGGEKLAVTENVKFFCTLSDNVIVSFRYIDRTETVSVRGYERVYLPRYDNDVKIAFWTTEGGNKYPSGGSAPASERTFIPVYEGYLRYDCYERGKLTSGGYARYGEEITLPQVADKNFKGWLLNGELTGNTVKIMRDSEFVAVFDGETAVFDLSRAEVRFTDVGLIYDGNEKRPGFELTINGELVPGQYYDYSYSGNVDAGEGVLTVRGKGLAYGSLTATFNIAPLRLFEEDVRVVFSGNNVYTGDEIRLRPTVYFNGGIIGENYYSLSYSGDLLGPGTVTVAVTFKGNYLGEVISCYEIEEAGGAPSVPPGQEDTQKPVTPGEQSGVPGQSENGEQTGQSAQPGQTDTADGSGEGKEPAAEDGADKNYAWLAWLALIPVSAAIVLPIVIKKFKK